MGGLFSSEFQAKMFYTLLVFSLRVMHETLRKIFAWRCQKDFRTWTHLKYRGRRFTGRRNSTIVSLTWSCKPAGPCEPCFIHKNELTKHTCYMLCWAQCRMNKAVTGSPCAKLLKIDRGCPQQKNRNITGQCVSYCLDIRHRHCCRRWETFETWKMLKGDNRISGFVSFRNFAKGFADRIPQLSRQTSTYCRS
jgi:hypothetical protein